MKFTGHYFLTQLIWYCELISNQWFGLCGKYEEPKTGFSISWRCGLGFYLVIVTTDELMCVTGLDLNSNFTASLGQLALVLGHSVEKVFSDVQGKCPVFHCGPFASDPVTGNHPGKRLTSIISVSSLQVFTCTLRTLWAFSKVTIPSSFSLSL